MLNKKPVRFLPFLAMVVFATGCSSSNRRAQTASDTTPPPPPAPISSNDPYRSSSDSAAAYPNQGDYREIIKLQRANLSEDFILQRISEDRKVYNLTSDQIIELRNNGISERVIAALQQSGTSAQGSVRIPEDSVSVSARNSGSPLTSSQASSGPSMTWEGLVRRNSGVVIFKSRWDPGTLTYSDGQVRWVDAKDSTKNLLIPERAINEQFLTCLKQAGGNECFEWGFRTRDDEEYRFRDVSWEQGGILKPRAVHDFFKSRFPNLIDSNQPVDEK
ncbi:MAG: hypothetical protein ABIT01_03575 [Thermoanaerobaculia bacterium]